jgi:acetyltransferase-like isoleucine patch superfamily enzyme
MVHPLADVQSKNIGVNSKVWQFTVVLEGASIGDNCNVNCHVFVENDVIIGNNVTIKSGVYLWDGLRIADDVFVGPNVTFVNDKRPRSKKYPDTFQRTIIENNASIGAAATIMGGLKLGAYSMVGAGALVTKDVAPRSLVIGSPAKHIAWLNDDGSKMRIEDDHFVDAYGLIWKEVDGNIVQL